MTVEERWQQQALGQTPTAAPCCGGRALAGVGPDVSAPPRLERLFEAACDEVTAARPDQLAVDGPALTYAELDGRANQLARHLLATTGGRRRVALLLDDPVDGYVATLATLKAGATYVPLDPAFPAGRIAHIASDAEVEVVVTRRHLTGGLAEVGGDVAVVDLDDASDDIRTRPTGRLPANLGGDDDIAYLIYTSGTTGRPKGVAISHRAICNFLTVAAACYGIAPDDRVYQGLTMAFDFSFEDTWVPWVVGATLVPKPIGANLLGPDLDAFIEQRRITALVCVPTLLATLRPDHPAVRFVLVSGEACPASLAARWHRPGRRLLNVYGPTEATVTATWTVLEPDRPVTIGVPLPTYSAVILDPDSDRALDAGERGEIGLGGVGLAEGYLGLPERTARAFVPDTVGLPDNPSGRIYRTGDLGRITADGEIEHLGRIDAQVKVRGYRIELGEVEAVLHDAPGISQAVVTTHEPTPGTTELVGWYRAQPGGADPGAIHAHLVGRLPGYMVPAYLEELEAIPLAASGKADRSQLGPPTRQRQTWQGAHVEAATDLEAGLAGLLATTLGIERVSVTADVFADLGANSLLMAQFVAAVADAGGLPPVSMRDVYRHPTVRHLAVAVAAQPATPDAPSPGDRLGPPRGRARHRLCGLAQATVFLVYVTVAGAALDIGGRWMSAGAGAAAVYGRAVLVGAALLAATGLAPVAAKWLLIGRFRPGRIRVWSGPYLRFWVVKTLVASNPVARFTVGTPLYNAYLRALGARVGPGAVILTRHVPVCTDQVAIGAGAVIRRDAWLNGYRAVDGIIEVDRVAVGDGAHVGERTVLDVASTVGAGARLGHASSLQPGQAIPAGEAWHGSPAEPGGDDGSSTPAPCPVRRARAAAGCVLRVVALLAVLGPLEAGASSLLVTHPAWARPTALDDAGIAAATVAGLLVLGLLISTTLPRVAAHWIEPGRTYPRHGVHHTLAKAADVLSNLRSLNALFGDSVFIVGYLRALGYRLGAVEQTGSNFGMLVRQDCPTLCSVGTATMVSDGLSIVNMDVSATSFRLRPAAVGRHNFVGNDVVFPAGARVGDNCLLATKVEVPLAGPVREGVGLLGSPSFEIPRSVERDRPSEALSTEPERSRRIRAKTRHNLVTIGLHLLVRWLWVWGLLAVGLTAWSSAGGWAGVGETAATTVADVALTIAIYALAERAVLRLRPLQPRSCSIYERPFWEHERFWKVPSTTHLQLLNGTPFKCWAWRLLGVRVGRQVFDDGCQVVERSMVAIGDRCTLNVGATLQGHSLEDGVFKSDRIAVGAGCTLGVAAFVHYGVEVGDGARVGADAFVMKGTRARPGTRWSGNPARELASAAPGAPAAPRTPVAPRPEEP